MSDQNSNPATLLEQIRETKLTQLWLAMLDTCLKILTEVPASEIKGNTLKEARAFLLDNDMTLDKLNPKLAEEAMRDMYGSIMDNLPTMEELDARHR